MASKTYNVGIVGYGFSAKIFHIPFVAEVPELKLYAIVQRTPKADDDAEKDHPGVKSFRTTEEMVQDPAIDIVIITTAPDSHFALSKLALEAGKHGTCLEVPERIYPANPMRVIVVCEKPFTPTTQEADELIAIAKKNNKQLAVFQSTSYQPNPNQLLESLD
jgi:predicted dehydrogenase